MGSEMSNPWLAVPLSEYERHMSSAEVQQLGTLSDLFGQAMRRCCPSSVAILGIAGGNGLNHIDSRITARVVGLDINPRYLDAVRKRYSHLAGLELHCVDLSEQNIELEAVELVHAALIFEHAGTNRCLENAILLTLPSGNLSIVLQLPGESEQTMGPSHFSSIQNLKSHFSLISPAWLRESLAGRGLRLVHQTTHELPAGKGFWMGIFCAPKVSRRR
jgi:SAM-dependent methyltransferase